MNRLDARIFDAPRERVFRAWTDPDEVAAWYGPAHMETPRERIRIDLRVGGRWEVTMVPRGGGGEFAIGYDILSDGPLPPTGRGHAEAGYHAALDKLAAMLAG
jgi:Activator of Hsp90 ATPase homolog 1-like protein